MFGVSNFQKLGVLPSVNLSLSFGYDFVEASSAHFFHHFSNSSFRLNGAGEQFRLVTLPDFGAVGQLVGYIGGVEYEAQSGGAGSGIVQSR